jgi:transcriptional regulator with XRE-family HTH domain
MRTRTRKRPKDPLDHIPEAVRYAREQAGLTQTQLAAMCDTTQGHVSEIETGSRNAPPPLIKKLAEALNCPRVILERNRHESETTPPAADRVRELRGAERADTSDVQELRSGALTDGAA